MRVQVARLLPITETMAPVDWDNFEAVALVDELRQRVGGPDGEKMIWAFEEAIRVARIDEQLLDYLLAAVVCMLARVDESTPRTVLELYFRRAVPDQEWRSRYQPLFD